MAGGGEPVEVVEVAHEALLRQWDTLQNWLQRVRGGTVGGRIDAALRQRLAPKHMG